MATPRRDKEPDVTVSEQLILLLVTLILAFAVGRLGGSDKWLTAIFCTVPTFAGIFAYFRRKISPKILWEVMAGAFVFHVALLWIIFGIILKNREDVSLLICIPGIFLEGFVLYYGIKYLASKL